MALLVRRPPQRLLSCYPVRPFTASSIISAARKQPQIWVKPENTTELPPPEEWRLAFPPTQFTRDRVMLKNPDTALQVAKSFIHWNWDTLDLKKPRHKPRSTIEKEGDPQRRGKVVIEAFPGPGQLTRALMQLPKDRIRKLIVLEDNESYLEYLKPLEALDPRVKILPSSGYVWDTYSMLEELGELDVKPAEWDQQQNDLQFIAQIPHSVGGEQLVSQFFRSIPEELWLFKYGRVPISFVMGEWMWKRISGKANTSERCKLSVIAEASSTFVQSLDYADLQPYDAHFHPTGAKTFGESKPEKRRLGAPMVAMNILPHADKVIHKGMMDKWDFCLRKLFVLKSTPLKKAIGSLAPGAQTLLKTLTDKNLPPEERVDVDLKIKALSLKDWALIMRAFDAWPFAPDDLAITDAFLRDKDRL